MKLQIVLASKVRYPSFENAFTLRWLVIVFVSKVIKRWFLTQQVDEVIGQRIVFKVKTYLLVEALKVEEKIMQY